MARKSALITGISGQDGAYLSKLLLSKGYKVYGTFRRLSTPNFWRLQYLDIYHKVNLIPCDLTDMSSITEAFQIARPTEVYNLAAQSFVSAAFEEPIFTGQVDGLAVAAILEVIRHTDRNIKFYQASTSEMYGLQGAYYGMGRYSLKALNEDSPFWPASPYGNAKLYGYWSTKIYRKAYDLFACQGILFNHESPIRGLEFVTRKISNGVAKIAVGLENNLELGNMKAIRDWGYAPEYVEAMWQMMQHKEPDDFVIATGRFHSVFDFAKEAFEAAGLSWKRYIKTSRRHYRGLDVPALRGDYSKAKKAFGWGPKTSFNQLVKIMVKEDISRWERMQKGEVFPWDAQNYPSEANVLTRALRE